MPDELKKKNISETLLAHYDVHARVLPWRISPTEHLAGIMPDPYRIWLSEVMLQQTTVATVTPRFAQFLKLWPTVADLAAAKLDDVLAEWAGLGYYARARNLHKCAQVVVRDYNGQFPDTTRELIKLPGIGPYTAAAIASIAFDQPEAVLDGNIERVMARLFAIDEPLPQSKKTLQECAAIETPKQRPGDHAQALMDLGATICTPRNPNCPQCPLGKQCDAYALGVMADLPVKKKKQKKPTRYGHAYIIRRAKDKAVFLIRRPTKGLLGGMIAPPSSEWIETTFDHQFERPIASDWKKIHQSVKHTFTHFHLVLDVFETELEGDYPMELNGIWAIDPLAEGLPTVFKKIFQ